MIDGDFNLVCNVKDKSDGVINHKWADLFMDWVNKFGLIELKPSSRVFTWTNNQEQPILAAIDKIFCTTNFEHKFSLAFVSTSSRASSDHVPLLLNFGLEERRKPSMFRFEKWWLQQPDFKELIAKLWNTSCAFTDPLDIWQFKIRLVRKKVKGWALNINAQVRKQKLELLKEYDLLDLKYENFVITEMERQRMKEIVKDLESIWKLEEIKARQRSRDRYVKEGDRNTAYFQAVINQRNRKKRISGLEGPDGWIDDNKGMLEHAVDFYRKLFGKEEDSGVKLGQDFWEVDEKVTALENELLEALLAS